MLETFSLSDPVEDKDSRRKASSLRPGSHIFAAQNRITDIREAAHSERVNIYVDDKFFCSLDISQVVDLKVKVGRILDDEEKLALKKASDFGKFYALALEYALMRPRSVKEMRDYLHRKTLDRHIRVKNRKTGEYQSKLKEGYDATLVAPVMERLMARGYLNDERFARLWVENRNVSKGSSTKKLRLELQQKGIAPQIIESVMDSTERNDQAELHKIATKRQGRYRDKRKFIQYLLRQGFNYSDILDELSSYDYHFEEGEGAE